MTIAEPTSKNRIYREIRRSIITGHLRPRERLDVLGLAKRYKTSVTPVRDALQMLGQDGLVSIKPRSGYYVTSMTLKELQDMFDLRKTLELASVERAALRISHQELELLREVHAGYTGDDDESYDRYTDENRNFHCLIAEASGNHEFARMLGTLHDRLARFMVLRHAGRSQEQTHARIVEALQAHDPVAARQALLEDIEGTHEAALDRVMQVEAASWELGS
jgi:DNA-binding GntR family transcriptional regulator